MKTLSIKLLSPDIPAPEYATAGSAGMDLCANVPEVTELAPGETLRVPTGLAIALPDAEHVALVCARSGLAIRHGITLANGVGVIDSDYRGEILVGLYNQSDRVYAIEPGERIAQFILTPYLPAQFFETETLTDTARGEGGFGSTGAK